MSLELSGTTGLKGVAGSVAAPSIVGDDTNTGISFPAADTIKFSTGGVERMSITNSGVTATGIPIVPPAFRAYMGAYQVLANNTNTKLTMNTETFDSNSFFDTSNYRFTPTIAGYYFINANTQFSNATANYVFGIHIYKNGSNALRGTKWNDGSNSELNTQISGILGFNGSSDYAEVYGYQNSGGNITVYNGTNTTYFEAFYIRPL